jgi:TonB family protein
MKKIIFIILILQSNLTFSQSKKAQIEQFKVSVDSLKNVLENERNVNLKKDQELNAVIVNFENQIILLKTEVKDVTNIQNQKQLENTQLKNNLNLNVAEISSLKSTLENERNSNLKKVQELNVAIVNFENQISLLKSEVKDAINNLNQKQLENTKLKADLNLYLTEIINLKIKTTTQSTNSNISGNKNLTNYNSRNTNQYPRADEMPRAVAIESDEISTTAEAPKAVEIEQPKEDEIFTTVEYQPEFPGGIKEMYGFIGKNLKYPSAAQRANVSGKVFVKFVVEKDGSLGDIQILKGIGFGCDEEAQRVSKSMPKWNPGKQNGRNVRVFFTMPISFVLE